MSAERAPLFPSRRSRFLVRRRQASLAVGYLALAVRLAGEEPYATWTLQEGWFRLNDARIGLEALA